MTDDFFIQNFTHPNTYKFHQRRDTQITFQNQNEK